MLQTDHIRIDPAYREQLCACSLDRVERVLARCAGRVAAWSRTTDSLYVSARPERPGFYVKRYYYPNWRQRLRGVLRGTFFGMHRGQAEARLLDEMRLLGLPAVRPVAYGARRAGHFVTACFLITEEVPEACNLTTFARDVSAGRRTLRHDQRKRIVCRFADEVVRLHAAGFAHGQLFWRNVLIRFGLSGEPEFFFLDVRPRHGGRRLGRGRRWWLRELSCLTASALPFTTRSERMRFLVEYVGARRLPSEIKQGIREIDRLARRWRRHERKRIKMNDLFDEWNRQLDAEDARLADDTADPPADIEGATL